MLSSYQIAAAIQQQNQMFSSAAQFAQQISAAVPQPMSGLGAFGGGQSGAQYPQMQGSANQQPGFSYAPSQGMSGYGFGNQMGAKAMSAIGGGGQAAMGLAGVAAGFMSLPIGLPIMAATSFGKHAFGSMVAGAQEQSNVDRVMGGMNFQNMASRTGRGFTRQDSAQIGDMMRSMANIPEMLTSMGELSRITDKIIQTGQMQGIKDVNQFQRKWKEAVTQLKDVARVMGTSMEGALPFLQEARASGLYNRADITNNMYARQQISASTGMNQQQIGQVQMMGSQMSFQRQGSRRTGALLGTRMMENIGEQLQSGTMSQDYLMEMTGMQGAEGAQALAAQRADMAYRMSRSAVGTVAALGLGAKSGGRFTGKMDMSAVEGVLEGRTSFGEIMGGARSKTGGRGSKISWARRKSEMAAEMAGALGPEGQAMLWQNILQRTAYKDDEDVQAIILQRHGFSDREAQDMLNSIRQLTRNRSEKLWNADADKDRIKRQAYFKENFSADALKKKIHQRISNVVTEPFKEIGAHMSTSIKERLDQFVDDLTGQYTAELRQGTAGLLQAGYRGDRQSRAQVKMLVGDQFGKGGGVGQTWAGAGKRLGYESREGDVLTAGGLQRAFNWAGGQTRAGESTAQLAREREYAAQGTGEGPGKYLTQMTAGGGTTPEQMREQIARQGNLSLGEQGSTFESLSDKQYQEGKRRTEFMMGEGGKKLAEEFKQQNPEGWNLMSAAIKARMERPDFAKMDPTQQMNELGKHALEWAKYKEESTNIGGAWTGGKYQGGLTVTGVPWKTSQTAQQALQKFGTGADLAMAVVGSQDLGGYGYGASAKDILGHQTSVVSSMFGGPIEQAAKRSKELERSLRQETAFSSESQREKGTMGWGDVKEAISKPGLARNLLFGSPTNKNNIGIFRQPTGTPEEQAKQKENRGKLINALTKDPSKWTEEEKELLRGVGENPEKLASNPARRKEMRELAATSLNLGTEKGEQLFSLAQAHMGEGIQVVSQELEKVGDRMATALKGESLTALAAGKVGKKESAAQRLARETFMKEYGAEAAELGDRDKRQSRAAFGSEDYHLTKAARAYSQMSGEGQKLARGGMDKRALAIATEYQTNLKKARGGGDVDALLRRAGYEGGEQSFGEGEAGRGKYSELKGIWDKKGQKTEDRAHAVAEFFAKQRETTLKAGGAQGNKYESEAKTAEALNKFADAMTKWSAEVNSKIGGPSGGAPGAE